MIFLLDNVIWIVSVIAVFGALCGILELVKKTRGLLGAISLVINAFGIVIAFIGGMELLTLITIIAAEFLVLSVAYVARSVKG